METFFFVATVVKHGSAFMLEHNVKHDTEGNPLRTMANKHLKMPLHILFQHF